MMKTGQSTQGTIYIDRVNMQSFLWQNKLFCQGLMFFIILPALLCHNMLITYTVKILVDLYDEYVLL